MTELIKLDADTGLLQKTWNTAMKIINAGLTEVVAQEQLTVLPSCHPDINNTITLKSIIRIITVKKFQVKLLCNLVY